MINNNPGGCGNDFALDDITLSECVKPTPVVMTAPKKTTVIKRQPAALKRVAKNAIPKAVKSPPPAAQFVIPEKDRQKYADPF
jgi:hypothetical protein